MPGGEPAERHSRSERDPGSRVSASHDRKRIVPRGVEPGNRALVRVEGLRAAVRRDPRVRSQVPDYYLDRVIRRRDDRRDADIRLDVRVAVEAVVRSRAFMKNGVRPAFCI